MLINLCYNIVKEEIYMNEEIWKDIKGYEGLYQISSKKNNWYRFFFF